MRKKYTPLTKSKIKAMVVEQGLNYKDISESFNGSPSANCISNWANRKDPKTGKTWLDLRQEHAEKQLAIASTTNMVYNLDIRIARTINSDQPDSKVADTLAKLTHARDRLIDPKKQASTMLDFMKDLLAFISDNYSDLLTEELREAVKSYKSEKIKQLTK